MNGDLQNQRGLFGLPFNFGKSFSVCWTSVENQSLILPKKQPQMCMSTDKSELCSLLAGEVRNPLNHSVGFIPGRVQAPEPQLM